ncbi:prolipoprotein diacylglyceryl transferase [Halorhodospira neutriphila]|uniref:Phosphatidylglycerol--prolipoprotein diacylglyceryl transferase n=1 Tax=Halorhodospira neutriphila TaxID=168379 RepID=A0ABS1E3N3_9GAMM|nr:prolipoprotein diacylglyceryl transferase [Halorhodospira neutriphila]MBK1725578.1 prolipoprotein diacylglyceryl transferase [Halorhodospira neutriphila]
MLTYPQINPIAVELGPVAIHWYGLMYVVGFLAAWGLGRWRARRPDSPLDARQVDDLVFFSALGVILGGKLGYHLFYNFGGWTADPLALLRLWEPGMSFHGGLIGVAVALVLYARRLGVGLLRLSDFAAPLVPIGLGAGRLGNFINGELWGRPSDVPWAMVYPPLGPVPRHPSQLYELALEGVALFAVVWWFSARPRAAGAVTGLFLAGYGAARFLVEFFRMPDAHLGFLALGWVTMGQLLSLPMIALGAALLWWAYRRPPQSRSA